MQHMVIKFCHGEDAFEAFTIMDIHGIKEAFSHLKKFYLINVHVIVDDPLPSADDSYREGRFVMIWNKRLDYIALYMEV